MNKKKVFKTSHMKLRERIRKRKIHLDLHLVTNNYKNKLMNSRKSSILIYNYFLLIFTYTIINS